MNPHDRHRQVDREQRRRQVSALMLAGVTDSERIASQLGVSSRTIRRDIAELEARWQVEAVQDISAAKGKDLERTERLIAALWPEAIKGQWLATDRVLALMQHRAALLGLNAPQKQEHTVDLTRYELVGISVAELRGVITPAITGGDD